MNGLDELLDFVRRNLLQTLFFGFIAVGILRKLVKQSAEEQARRSAGGMPLPPVADGDLREQVRRGFEEMMRQRAAAASARATAKAPPKGASGAAPGPTSRSAPRVPQKVAPVAMPRVPRVPVTAPRMPAPMATATGAPSETVRAAAATTAARAASLAKERLAGRRLTVVQPSVARRLLQDRRSVRRAFLLREILDLPRSLREGS